MMHICAKGGNKGLSLYLAKSLQLSNLHLSPLKILRFFPSPEKILVNFPKVLTILIINFIETSGLARVNEVGLGTII